MQTEAAAGAVAAVAAVAVVMAARRRRCKTHNCRRLLRKFHPAKLFSKCPQLLRSRVARIVANVTTVAVAADATIVEIEAAVRNGRRAVARTQAGKPHRRALLKAVRHMSLSRFNRRPSRSSCPANRFQNIAEVMMVPSSNQPRSLHRSMSPL